MLFRDRIVLYSYKVMIFQFINMSRANLYLVANGETVRVAGARGDTEIECELKGAHLRVLRKPQQLSILKGRCRIKGCINLISNYKALERLNLLVLIDEK